MTRRSTLWRRSIAPAGLLLLVALLYAPWLGNGFIYDDRVLIIGQVPPESIGDALRVFAEPHYRSLDYYRPIVRLTMVVQKGIHGDEPFPYHLFNIAIMGVAALLAYALLRLPVFGIRRLPAFLGAALFALHPIAAQCVYPITGRETTIFTIFTIATFCAFLRKGRGWRLAAMLLLAATFLCKEQAVVLPVFFVLADALRLSADPPGRSAGAWLRRYLPVGAIAAAYFLLRALFFGRIAGVQLAVLDEPAGPLQSLLYKLQVTFAPFVALVYEPRFEVWFSVWRLSLAIVLVACIVVLSYRFRETLGAQPLLWLGWFVVASLPTSNIVFQEAPFAERYEFLSLVAVAAILAAVASAARARLVAAVIGVVLLAGCAAISFHRGGYFESDAEFIERWLQSDPASPQAHASYGELLGEKGKRDEAMEQYREALRLDPGFLSARINLANELLARRKPDEAIGHYLRVLEEHPETIEALNNLGAALELTGKPAEAEARYRRALEIDPDAPVSHFNLASVLYASGRFSEAIPHLRRTLALMPEHDPARALLDSASSAQQEVERIITFYRARGVALKERAVAHAVLASELAAGRRLEEAAEQYRRAVTIDPGYAEAHSNLGVVLQMRGDLHGAVQQYRRALEIDPGNGEFHYNLGTALLGLNEREEAIDNFKRALELAPTDDMRKRLEAYR